MSVCIVGVIQFVTVTSGVGDWDWDWVWPHAVGSRVRGRIQVMVSRVGERIHVSQGPRQVVSQFQFSLVSDVSVLISS